MKADWISDTMIKTYSAGNSKDTATCGNTVIATRRRAATSMRGVMVIARTAGDEDFNARVTVPWDYAHDAAGNACKASMLLIEKLRSTYPDCLQWAGNIELTGGYIGNTEYVFAIRSH